MNLDDPMRADALSIARGPAHAPAPAAGRTPLEWFGSRLAARPHAPAVVSGSDTWSYQQVSDLADRLAQALKGRIAPGELVGVRLDRSPLIVATAVALARLGAVYVPLGSTQGADRVLALADDAGLNRMVTAGSATGPAGWEPQPIDSVDGLCLASRAGVHADAPGQSHTDAFYAVTTSGSTGTPKVVLVPETALTNLTAWYCELLGLGPGSRVSLLVDITFDAHLMEMWAALSSGATLHVAPHDVRSSPSELELWWQEEAITHCFLPTPLGELMLGRPWPAGLALRHLALGGDRMRSRPSPDCATAVHNMYGPAEATVITTVHRVEPASDTAGPVSIGRPINGVTLYVTDPDGRLLPREEAGELLIAGAGLALGYVDPRSTAERFARGPANRPDAERVYRTGDRVVMHADGLVEFLGRLDDQVKISGARIELGEVEVALEAHPAVRQAVAVPVPGVGGERRLAAFLRLTDGARPDAAAVLSVARTRLLEQAVPAVVRFVDRFPLNDNGKIDRARLLRQLPPAAGRRSCRPRRRPGSRSSSWRCAGACWNTRT